MPPSAEPLLSFAAVGKRFPDGLGHNVVLEGVSFELFAGDTLGVYGERRSGKSTLLRLGAGIEPPQGGSVRFAGRDLARCSAGERARLLRGPVALLACEATSPMPGETVMDHVAIAVGSAGLSLRQARRRALQALDTCGVAGACAQEALPLLAPAERARVALARALVHEPRLLLVDEPTPVPSLLERDRFCALLRSVARERGLALIVASEDMTALQGLSALAALSAGKLCSTQRSAEVLAFPQLRAQGG